MGAEKVEVWGGDLGVELAMVLEGSKWKVRLWAKVWVRELVCTLAKGLVEVSGVELGLRMEMVLVSKLGLVTALESAHEWVYRLVKGLVEVKGVVKGLRLVYRLVKGLVVESGVEKGRVMVQEWVQTTGLV
jgi:hypothetical protein